MPFDERAKARYFSGMRRRIVELRAQSERSLDFAIDTMMLERAESYFKVETGLVEIERMVTLIEEELDEVRELTHAQRLEARSNSLRIVLKFNSEIYHVPSDAGEKSTCLISSRKRLEAAKTTASQGEINSHQEAYQALGLDFGSSMTAVTRAFRQKSQKAPS